MKTIRLCLGFHGAGHSLGCVTNLCGHTFFYHSYCISILAKNACTSISDAHDNNDHPRSSAANREKGPSHLYFQRKQGKYTGFKDPKANNPRNQFYLRHA